MRNVTRPSTVSFEDALRNLASRLTGQPTSALPRTQEAIVQYMAENIPDADEMAEAITQEVLARLQAATEDPATGAEGSTEEPEGPGNDEGTAPTDEGAEGAEKPKRSRNKNTKTTN